MGKPGRLSSAACEVVKIIRGGRPVREREGERGGVRSETESARARVSRLRRRQNLQDGELDLRAVSKKCAGLCVCVCVRI